MLNVGTNIFFRIIRKLIRTSFRAPKAIIGLFALDFLIFAVQLLFSIFIASILGGKASERFASYLPVDLAELAPPLTKIWLLVCIFLIVKITFQYCSNHIGVRIRRKIEISIAQEFIDFMRMPPQSETDEIIRNQALMRGPSIMTMGSKESGIVGLLITRFIGKIPFILTYLVLLALWFPKESLYAVLPCILALSIMIILSLRSRSLSTRFMESMPSAIAERRSLWLHLPRTMKDSPLEQSPLTDLDKGKTGNQYLYFYKRHFRTLTINFIAGLLLLVALGASIYQFNLRVISGDAVWVECIIMIALGQLLISDLNLGVNAMTTFSRNFESIRRVTWPLVAKTDEAHIFEPAETQTLPLEDEDEESPILPQGHNRLALVSMNLGTHYLRKNILSTLHQWDINVEIVLTRDHFPKPLPKALKDLRALGKAFPENAVLSARVRHHRPELLKQWRAIYKAMGNKPIVLVCETRDQIKLAKELDFTLAAISLNGELVEIIDLTQKLH